MLIGENISEVKNPFTEETSNVAAIIEETRNVPKVKNLVSSHKLFSVPVDYVRDNNPHNNPPMPIKNSREKSRDLGKKQLAREAPKGTWKKIEKQPKATIPNPSQPTISSLKKRTVREDAEISKSSVSSSKRIKILEVTHNDLCSMATAADQPRRVQ